MSFQRIRPIVTKLKLKPLSERLAKRKCPACGSIGLDQGRLANYEGVLIKCRLVGVWSNDCHFAVIVFDGGVRFPDNNRSSL
jgi:hypothetical protein